MLNVFDYGGGMAEPTVTKALRTTETTWRGFRSFATAHGLDSDAALIALLEIGSAQVDYYLMRRNGGPEVASHQKIMDGIIERVLNTASSHGGVE